MYTHRIRHLGTGIEPSELRFESEDAAKSWLESYPVSQSYKDANYRIVFNIPITEHQMKNIGNGKPAGKKWLGENTQQYRPTKRKDGREADNWQCRDAHSFVDGFCERCKEPEIDELEAVECDYCRAIFEHTGQMHCPIHEFTGLPYAAPTPSLTAASAV
jgi:hypothetical protein